MYDKIVKAGPDGNFIRRTSKAYKNDYYLPNIPIRVSHGNWITDRSPTIKKKTARGSQFLWLFCPFTLSISYKTWRVKLIKQSIKSKQLNKQSRIRIPQKPAKTLQSKSPPKR